MRQNHCDVNSFELPDRLYGYIFYHYLTTLIIAFHHISHIHRIKKVEDIGVEPMTLCVQGRCSSQLS